MRVHRFAAVPTVGAARIVAASGRRACSSRASIHPRSVTSVRAALAGEAAVVRNPAAIRPWQHVLNPLSGYLLLAQALWEEPAHAEGWNFGPDELDARPVGWVVERLAELWGEGLDWRSEGRADRPHEATYLKLDSSRARGRLGWAPAWGLDEALGAIVEWYAASRAEPNIRDVTLRQIRAFSRSGGALASADA